MMRSLRLHLALLALLIVLPAAARAAAGDTPLHLAASRGDASATLALLRQGARPGELNRDGFTPLHLAAFKGHDAVVAALLGHGADVDSRPTQGHSMSPLLLALVGGHEATARLLRARGADEEARDEYGQPPERAAELMRQRAARPRQAAAERPQPFDPRALVTLIHLARTPQGYVYRGIRNAFVIEGGALIVTAAHCVADFTSATRRATLAAPLVASPYYGDLFEARIIDVDPENDIALLCAPWKSHPALTLATAREVRRARELIIAGLPAPETTGRGIRLPRQPLLEQIPLLRADPAWSKTAVALGGARWVGPGWSGSPMILPGSGRLAGVFGRWDAPAIDGTRVMQTVMGAHVQSLAGMLGRPGVGRASQPPPPPAPRDAAAATAALFAWLEAQANNNGGERLAQLEKAAALRPASAQIQIQLARAWADACERDPRNRKARQLAEGAARRAVELAGQSPAAHAARGCERMTAGQYREALAEFGKARPLAEDPAFIQALEIQCQSQLDPVRGIETGRRLTRENPEAADLWNELAGALQRADRHTEAVPAARRAAALGGETVYFQRRLADACADAGQFDDARAAFTKLLAHHDCPVCWMAYAGLLADRGKGCAAEARAALAKAERFNHPPQVPAARIRALRDKIDARR